MRLTAWIKRAQLGSFILAASGGWTHAAMPADFEAFAKRCDLYGEKISGGATHLEGLLAESRKLSRAKVPIYLNLQQCDAVRHEIRLHDGNSTNLRSGFPTNADPDDKSMRYKFVRRYISKKYWMFEGHGWEWQTWILIDKRHGLQIETPTECGPDYVSERGSWIVSICSGNYDNTQPTVYATYVNGTARWTEGFPINNCAGDGRFSGEIRWLNADSFSVKGRCELTSRSHAIEQRFSVSEAGLVSKSPNAKAIVAGFR